MHNNRRFQFYSGTCPIFNREPVPFITIAILATLLVLSTCAGCGRSKESQPPHQYYTVTKVLDGDSIVLNDDITIRLIGIDSPEYHFLAGYANVFHWQATKFLKELCLDKQVRLEYDERYAKQNHREKGRGLLAYLYLKDGTFINAHMLKEGFAFYYEKVPTKYKDDFLRYEEEAKEAKKGLWGAAEKMGERGHRAMEFYFTHVNKRPKETAR